MSDDVKGTIVFGLDPGVTLFGVVAIEDPHSQPLHWATFHSRGKDYSDKPTYHRVVQLTEQVTSWIKSKTADYRHVVVVIEKPVYTKNARAFEIQWRLFQQVLTILRHVAAPNWFLEVSPGTAKKALTGNGSATKLDMVCASHFDGPEFDRKTAEALADAEGIANCWWGDTEAYSPLSKDEACRNGAITTGP